MFTKKYLGLKISRTKKYQALQQNIVVKINN